MFRPLQRLVIVFSVFLLISWYFPAACRAESTLDRFEKDVTNQTDYQPDDDDEDQDDDKDHGKDHGKDKDHGKHGKDKKPDGDNENDHHWEDNDGYPWVARVVVRLIDVCGRATWVRVANPDECIEDGLTPRKIGDPTLPLFRIDASARNISSDIDAFDFRAEAGYAFLAVQYNQSEYNEHNPPDKMKISGIYGVYRTSISPVFEIDLGVGTVKLHGNTATSKASLTLPILIYPRNSRLGLEFRPAWADNFEDYDLALLYSTRYSSLKAGYRWILSPNYSLSGPYLGVSARL